MEKKVVLEDVITDGLVVVFCGTATGERTEKAGEYYAGGRNKFWPLLSQLRITPRQLRPAEASLLLAYDIGLTDLVRKRTAADVEPSDDDFDIAAFKKKIAEHRPTIVAFNGTEPARLVLNRDSFEYGRQPEKLSGAIVYVLPSTSDKANEAWDEKYWRELAAEVNKLRRGK